MERYHIVATGESDGYRFEVNEAGPHDPRLLAALMELDLLTYTEPTFSRYTAAAFLRHGHVFTARADELLIGACHCMRDYNNPREVVIFNMALRPGWRGHGLGTRFLTRILLRLREQGVHSVVLQVAQANSRAVFVYEEKFGFERVETLENEFGNAQVYFAMRLDLTVWQPGV